MRGDFVCYLNDLTGVFASTIFLLDAMLFRELLWEFFSGELELVVASSNDYS